MALDFIWLDSGDSGKISLSNGGYSFIYPAIEVLKAKTGIYIDQYSDTRLSPQHAALLVSNIKIKPADVTSELSALIKMLSTAGDKSWWILVQGD